METQESNPNMRVHHGHNIQRTRREKKVTQVTLEKLLDFSKGKIGYLETKAKIDDETLDKIAKALNVPVEILKETEEERPCIVIENNTFNGENSNNSGYTEGGTWGSNNHYYSPEAYVELYKTMMKEQDIQYNRIFQVMEKKCQLLEKHIELLGKQIDVQNKQIEDFFAYLKSK